MVDVAGRITLIWGKRSTTHRVVQELDGQCTEVLKVRCAKVKSVVHFRDVDGMGNQSPVDG